MAPRRAGWDNRLPMTAYGWTGRAASVPETARVSARPAAAVLETGLAGAARSGLPASADLASRVRLANGLHATAGNRAVAELAGLGRARALQRDAPGGGGTATTAATGQPQAATTGTAAGATAGGQAAPAGTLSNGRFTPHARLRDIASGGGALSRSDPSPAIKAVQTALLDIGYSLLRYKDDGKYGGETTGAIAQFRTDRGLPAGDVLDTATMLALDQRATAPGRVEEHYLDYGRLFGDGRLDVTLAIGYDEGQTHFDDLKSARDWMASHGMAKGAGGAAGGAPQPQAQPPALLGGESIATTGGTSGAAGAGSAAGASLVDPDADTRRGISTPEHWTGKRTVSYPDQTGARVSKEITVSITLIPPGTGAKASFAKGLNESELTLYSGHARRGIGPDFDPDKSPYENFVIGVNSALHKAGRLQAPDAVAQSHYVIGKQNDLEQMKNAGAWDPEKYRVWFFNACSSIAYFDELRGGLLPDKMDRHNLDLFGTNQEVPIAAGLASVFANLEGILSGDTMEGIVRRMQRDSMDTLKKWALAKGYSEASFEAGAKGLAKGMFEREGAGDNQVAAAP